VRTQTRDFVCCACVCARAQTHTCLYINGEGEGCRTRLLPCAVVRALWSHCNTLCHSATRCTTPRHVAPLTAILCDTVLRVMWFVRCVSAVLYCWLTWVCCRRAHTPNKPIPMFRCWEMHCAVCVRMCTHTRKSVCISVCVSVLHVHSYAHTCTHTHLHMHTHTHVHTRTHTHTHLDTDRQTWNQLRTDAQTHTQTHRRTGSHANSPLTRTQRYTCVPRLLCIN